MLADCFVGSLDVGFAQGLSPRLRSIWQKENCLLLSFLNFLSLYSAPQHTAGRKDFKLGCKKSLCREVGMWKKNPKYHLSAGVVGNIVFAAH